MQQARCECGIRDRLGGDCGRFFVYQRGLGKITLVCTACGISYTGWEASGGRGSIDLRPEGVSPGLHEEVAGEKEGLR